MSRYLEVKYTYFCPNRDKKIGCTAFGVNLESAKQCAGDCDFPKFCPLKTKEQVMKDA